MSCDDVLKLSDLETAKKHDNFHTEVITGKKGGADISHATNAVTGQLQQTLPHAINSLGGMGYARVGTFATGATLTTARETLLFEDDGQEYGWSGTFPKVVTAGSTPQSTGGIAAGAWVSRFDPSLREYIDNTNTVTFKNEFGYSAVDNMIAGRVAGVVVEKIHKIGSIYSSGGTSWEYVGNEGVSGIGQFKLISNGVHISDFGSVPHIALQAALDTGYPVILPVGEVDLGGNIITSGSGTTILDAPDTVLTNGSLTILQKAGANVYVGDLSFEECDFIVGGNIFESNHMTNVTLGDLTFKNSVFGPRYISNFTFGCIRVIWDKQDGSDRQAIGNLTCLYHGTIKQIHMSGYYAMGFQTAGNGSQDVYNTNNVSIGNITSLRNPASIDVSGYHGVYLLGNNMLKVGSIYSTGYEDSVGVSNALKFRDSWGCDLGDIHCDSIQLASDANTGAPLVSLDNNIIRKLDLKNPLTGAIGSLRVTVSSTGVMSDNEIHWFRGDIGTSGVIPTKGVCAITMYNYVYLSQSALQADSIRYRDARILSSSSTNKVQFTRDLHVDGCDLHFNVETMNANHFINNSKIFGALTGDSTAGTKISKITNSVIEGTLIVNTYGIRVWNATWVNIDVLANYQTSATSVPNGANRFRNVSFNNRVYKTSQTDFVDIV